MAFIAATGLFLLSVNASAQAPASGQSLKADPAASTTVVRALLVPATESVISSQLSAQVVKIAVEEGQRFKKGKVLVRYECAENRAEAQKARAELDAVSKTLLSNERLLQYKAINRLEVEISQANVNRAKAQLNLMNARVRHCAIIAPYAGRVAKLGANLYDTVSVGQPVIEILDDSSLKMELYVPSRWLSWLKKGQKFSVKIDETGKTYPALVQAMGPRVDPVSQTIAVYAEIAGKHPELLAGMSGVAKFPRPE